MRRASGKGRPGDDREERGPRRVRGFQGPGLAGAAVIGLALLATASAGRAQTQTPRVEEECRCVDRSGAEIENCTCMRSPRVILDELAFGPGFTRRAQIGVWVEPSKEEDGAYVTRVQDGGPADEAGVRAGDVVLRVNDRSLLEPLDDPEAEEALNPDEPLAIQRFVRLVGKLEPEEEATLEVRRDGEQRTLTVTPERAEPRIMVFGSTNGSDMARSLRRLEGMERRAEREQERALRSWGLQGDEPAVVWRFDQGEPGTAFRVFTDSLGGGAFRFDGRDPCFALHAGGPGGLAFLGGGNCVDGVEFIELDEELGAYFGASRGVLVTEVADEATLGLRPGDVLLAVDGRTVEDPGHTRRIIESYLDDEEIRLRVIREGREIEVLGRRFAG